MAQAYTDMSKPYGRERYSGSAWMGEHGRRAVDLAWEDRGGQDRWQDHAELFPADLREDAKQVYESALDAMRKHALAGPVPVSIPVTEGL